MGINGRNNRSSTIMGFDINITGDVNKLFKERTRTLMDKIENEMDAFGHQTVSDAKRLTPVDEGKLRQSISYEKGIEKKSFFIEIVAATNYAAYLEFGTKRFAAKYVATLPKEWKEFAAIYKGPGGGSFDEFVMRLTRWVRMKKIGATYSVQTKRRDRVGKQSAATTAEADAYAIALHIMRNGIMAQPFLYPAIEKNRIKLLKNLKALT